MYRTYDWQVDLRAGGKWSTRARGSDGTESTVGTRVRITHTGFIDRAAVAEGTGEGWKRVLEWAAEHIEAG